MIEMKYTSWAYPPHNIKLNKTYTLEKNSKGYVVCDVTEKIPMELNDIKSLFTPINGAWEEVLKTSKNTKKTDE